MSTRICAADDCDELFEPVLPEQMYCTRRCSTRMRVKRYRQRHKHKPNGGGPRGTRLLFPKSELHRRKPAKSALEPKPKPGELFPEGLYATQAGGVEYTTLADGTSQVTCYRTRKKQPRSTVNLKPESPLAA